MAESARDQTRSVEQLTIVDTDAHLMETVDDILPYIENENIKSLIERTERPLADIYSVTHSLPPYLESDGIGFNNEGMNSPQNKLEDMDDFDIDYGILDPGLNLTLPSVNNTRCAVELAKAYNSWILDNFLDNGTDRFKANLTVAHHKPDKAAEEIDRVGDEDGIVGVVIPSTGVVPPLGHSRYDPIYEAAQDHDLPICLHGASTNTSHVFPLARIFNETYAEDHSMIHPFSQMWEFISMMFQGVPERYPDLDFVIQEAGISWVPYLKWRMDDHYLSLDYELPYVEKLPSEYISDQFYFTTQPLGHTKGKDQLAKAIELAGPENIMYSSDLPHKDFDPPEELFERIQHYFDEDVVAGLMGKTAEEVFNI